MNRHLSSQEISEWTMGERTAEMEQHARDCPACQAELEQFGTALSLFRGSAQGWADRQCLSEARTIRRIRQAPFHALLNAFCWAALGIIICTAGVFTARHRAVANIGDVEQSAPDSADSDVALLQRVNAEVSQTAPSSLEPLAELVSWQAAGSPRAAREREQ